LLQIFLKRVGSLARSTQSVYHFPLAIVKPVQHFNSVFQRWKFTRSSIHCAVDSRKSNTEFDAVQLRQILTKCSKIKQAYEVLCAKWTRKILCKNIFTLHRYRDFRVGAFYSDSACIFTMQHHLARSTC